MKKKKKVSWALGVPVVMQVDFGMFKASKGNTIEVDSKFWEIYCQTRLNFELMQQELFDKMNKKDREIIKKNTK